ncbi:hypothetical protein, partial [Runella limosa]|uniref:hypothetical protein n=1 Tax=Runella limosa TaxID=370978 RepID=UPI000563D09B
IALFGIAQQPQNEVVCNVGTATASFKITVLGNDITYQWQKNGVNILWATSSTYTFTPTIADHDAKFRCIVKSSSCATSITSEEASLRVYSTYTAQTVCANGTTTLTAPVVGQGITYQWYRTTGGVSSPISGANTATYTITPTAADFAYTYRVLMTDAACTNGRYGPQTALFGIAQQPSDALLCSVGASVSYKVIASTTVGTTYQWQKDGVNIAGATTDTYTFTPTTADQQSKFQCIVKNGNCTLTSKVVALSVGGIATHPQSQTICASNGPATTVTLRAKGNGTNPQYQWYRLVPGNSTPQAITLSTDKTKDSVWVQSIGTIQNGYQFYAQVTTTCGTATTNIATITISTPPTPTLAGSALRSLCPDSTARLIATGCTGDVKWSYTLKTTSGVLATTNDTLSLAYNTSLLTAWSTGDTLALTAACTLPNCGASAPSTTVKVVKKQSCATVPVARTASICDIYIKATNAQGQEVSKLTRAAGGGFQPVTLSLVGLADTTLLNFPNLTYRWTAPTGQTALSGTGGAASKIGDYKVVVKSGNDSCEVFFTLSGTPCVVRDYSTATCQTLTINAPAQGNSLSNLAVGDIFNAADYTITVTEATGGATGWSGKGYVSVLLPMGVTQNVAVTFDNIAINDCYELVNGKIELVVDPNKQLLDVDDAWEGMQDLLAQTEARIETAQTSIDKILAL